jgi:hypothetical protein
MNHDTWVTVGSIRVLLGEIFNAVVRVGAGSEVYTNDLTAAAEGTKFLLRIDPVSTTVTVIEGRVLCTPTAGGAWHPFTITANQQISGTSRGYAGVPIDGMRRASGSTSCGAEAAARFRRPGSTETRIPDHARRRPDGEIAVAGLWLAPGAQRPSRADYVRSRRPPADDRLEGRGPDGRARRVLWRCRPTVSTWACSGDQVH